MDKGDSAALVTRRAMAAMFGVAMLTVTKWERDGLPIAERGGPGRASRYSMPECIRWYADREARARGGTGAGGALLSPAEQRAALDQKRTEEIDLRVRLRRGELVEVEEAARDLANVATATKARLRRIPNSIADQVLVAAKQGPGAVKALLLSEIDDALRELAAHGEPAEAESVA